MKIKIDWEIQVFFQESNRVHAFLPEVHDLKETEGSPVVSGDLQPLHFSTPFYRITGIQVAMNRITNDFPPDLGEIYPVPPERPFPVTAGMNQGQCPDQGVPLL